MVDLNAMRVSALFAPFGSPSIIEDMKSQDERSDTREAQQKLLVLVEKRTREILARADEIVVSQDVLDDQVGRLSEETASALEAVGDAVSSVGAAFDDSLSELVWLVEQGSATMRKVLDVLRAPLGTQARELRQRAEHAYSRGWMDEALADFMESEKANRYDFAVLFYIANIHYYHRDDMGLAREYYEKVVRYAAPESPVHAALALLHMSRIDRRAGAIESAHSVTSRALAIHPALAEVHLEHARNCAVLGRTREALEHVLSAIGSNRLYCARALEEADLRGIHREIKALLEHLRDLLAQRCVALAGAAELLAKEIANLDDLSRADPSTGCARPRESFEHAPTSQEVRPMRPAQADVSVLAVWDTLRAYEERLQGLFRSCAEAQHRVELQVSESAWAKAAADYSSRVAGLWAGAVGVALGVPGTAVFVYAMVRHYGPDQFSDPWTWVAAAIPTVLALCISGGIGGVIGLGVGKHVASMRLQRSALKQQFESRRTALSEAHRTVGSVRGTAASTEWRSYVLEACNQGART